MLCTWYGYLWIFLSFAWNSKVCTCCSFSLMPSVASTSGWRGWWHRGAMRRSSISCRNNFWRCCHESCAAPKRVLGLLQWQYNTLTLILWGTWRCTPYSPIISRQDLGIRVAIQKNAGTVLFKRCIYQCTRTCICPFACCVTCRCWLGVCDYSYKFLMYLFSSLVLVKASLCASGFCQKAKTN